MWMFCTRLKMYKAASRDFNFFKRDQSETKARPSGGGDGDVYGADRPNASDPPP